MGYAFQQRKHRKMRHIRDESFLPGAEMAFIQVAAGVFQMRASHMLVPLEQESAEAESMASGAEGFPLPHVAEGSIVDPRDVMQEKLADFYLQAATATKVSRCTPFYRLHGICGSKVSNVNILYGASRGNLPQGKDVKDYMGTKLVWESLSKDLEALMRYRWLNDPRMVKTRLSSIRQTTVHVDVDIRCRETFFVMDDRTEEVVQGSKAVGLRTHRLRLEGSPFLKHDFHWTAVDLDHWMKGNTFW